MSRGRRIKEKNGWKDRDFKRQTFESERGDGWNEEEKDFDVCNKIMRGYATRNEVAKIGKQRGRNKSLIHVILFNETSYYFLCYAGHSTFSCVYALKSPLSEFLLPHIKKYVRYSPQENYGILEKA